MTGDDLGRLTSSESSTLGDLLLVPLGSTEQHGPHLPLGTDTLLAVAWAEALAHRLAGVVAPALPYGSAGEHQAFAGTISIGQDALETVLVELVRSASLTFARVVLVSGHAGNVDPVGRAVTRLTGEGHSVISLFPRWPVGDERFPRLDAHAGRVETSLLLYLSSDLVRQERAAAGAMAPLADLLDEMRRKGVAEVAPNGVLGDPAGANPAEGRALFDDLVERSIDEVGRAFSGPADP